MYFPTIYEHCTRHWPLYFFHVSNVLLKFINDIFEACVLSEIIIIYLHQDIVKRI